MGMALLVAAQGQASIVNSVLPALTCSATIKTRPMAAALVMAHRKEGYTAGIRVIAEGYRDSTVGCDIFYKGMRVLMLRGS